MAMRKSICKKFAGVQYGFSQLICIRLLRRKDKEEDTHTCDVSIGGLFFLIVHHYSLLCKIEVAKDVSMLGLLLHIQNAQIKTLPHSDLSSLSRC